MSGALFMGLKGGTGDEVGGSLYTSLMAWILATLRCECVCVCVCNEPKEAGCLAQGLYIWVQRSMRPSRRLLSSALLAQLFSVTTTTLMGNVSGIISPVEPPV